MVKIYELAYSRVMHYNLCSPYKDLFMKSKLFIVLKKFKDFQVDML